MKTTTILTVTLIAGAILLITGTSVTSIIIRTAFADANQVAPGQNFGGPHRNPSGGSPPPGHATSPPVGNSGQCLKAGFPRCFLK